jgi:hypothetical protein
MQDNFSLSDNNDNNMKKYLCEIFAPSSSHTKYNIKKIFEIPGLLDWMKTHCDPILLSPNCPKAKLYQRMYYSIIHPDEKLFCSVSNVWKKLRYGTPWTLSCVKGCECSKEKIKKTNIKRYGVKNIFQNSEIKEKIRKTNKKKYGVEYPLQSTDIKKKTSITNLKKYGVENPAQSKLIKEKIKKTNIEKYGVKCTLSSSIIKEKIKKTNIEKYDCENPIQSKIVKEKYKNTNLKRYSVENPFQSAICKEKIKETNIEKYGVSSPQKSKIIREKTKKTNLERYSAENPSCNLIIRNKIKNTNLTNEIRNKIKNTNIERYGVSYFAQQHISEASLKILADKNLLRNELTHLSANALAKKLGCHPSTICFWHNRYNLGMLQTGSSSFETEISAWLTENNIKYIQHDRNICKPKELDFLLPQYKLALEFDGLYWHSELGGGKDKWYHQNKYSQCRKNNIQLLTIFEDEWIKNSEIIKKHILHLCHCSTTVIGARKFIIKEITFHENSKFLTTHHIQGAVAGTFYLGAFHNNILKATITLTKVSNKVFNIARYATDQAASYPGLFSKFVSYIFSVLKINKLITFADLRWSIGNLYSQSGFTQCSIIGPDYFYTDYNVRSHKFKFRKSKMAKILNLSINQQKQLTENQMRLTLGLDRIWDCGKIKFEKINQSL